MFRRLRWAELSVIAALALAALGCGVHGDRSSCARDEDCASGDVCYEDDKCVPIDVAIERGAIIGDECGPSNGRAVGCEFLCRMGVCDGPPAFDGATSAVSDGDTAIIVSWRAARDQTASSALSYLVFMSTSAGVHLYSSPTQTVVGETSIRVDGLETGRTYYFVVRASDARDQVDTNRIEVSAVPGCVDYTAQVQPILDAKCTSCHGVDMAHRGLRLDGWLRTMAGTDARESVVACRSGRSRLATRTSVPPPSDAWPEHGELSEPERAVIARWIDGGAGEICVTASTPSHHGSAMRCSDTTAPAFDGILAATLVAPAEAVVCWASADDDETAPDAMVYELWEAATTGAEDFSAQPAAATRAGETCLTMRGLAPSEQYCWVVRARDEAGNQDTNTAERCVTVPGTLPACIEYEEVVAPLFARRCTYCHGDMEPRRMLDLSTLAGIMTGSMAGAVVRACEPDMSFLIEKITSDMPSRGVRMPHDGPPYLRATEIEAIRRWIAEGARATCADPNPC